MIVTSCVIPLLVLVAFLWLGHVLLGIDISGPANYLTGRFLSAPSKHAKKGGQSEWLKQLYIPGNTAEGRPRHVLGRPFVC